MAVSKGIKNAKAKVINKGTMESFVYNEKKWRIVTLYTQPEY